MFHVMDSLADLSDPERVADRIAFRARLESEESAAAALCERALTGPSAWWSTRLRQEDGFLTSGVVRELAKRFPSSLLAAPREALVLTTLATEIAFAIGVSEYPFDHVVTLRGQALRDHAFVLSFIGRFLEAAATAERADSCLRQIPVPDLELARLDLVRSNIARSTDKLDQAIAFARRAGETFLWFGDRRNWLKACDYEASAYYAQHDYARALEVWQATEKYVHLLGPVQEVALLHNLGLCYAETGALAEAIDRFTRAVEEFEFLGADANRVKSRHCLGEAFIAAGRYPEAIAVLREAQNQFESLGMESDAALTALKLSEALLVAGRVSEVAEISRNLIDSFTRAGMTTSAMTALAFLRETLATGHATPVLVRHVHDFLRDLRPQEERLFAPPE
jgi:tetratricopeptide (TPR) repeat protein